MKQYRHGDLLIVEVESIPAEVEPRDGLILAYGEVTNHKHVVDVGELFETIDGKLYLRLNKKGKLKHEEHNTILLPPGNYEVIRQMEYSPERIRRVQD